MFLSRDKRIADGRAEAEAQEHEHDWETRVERCACMPTPLSLLISVLLQSCRFHTLTLLRICGNRWPCRRMDDRYRREAKEDLAQHVAEVQKEANQEGRRAGTQERQDGGVSVSREPYSVSRELAWQESVERYAEMYAMFSQSSQHLFGLPSRPGLR